MFSVCCVFAVSSEPSAVSGLAVSSRTFGSLGLSWQAGPGRTQRFRLQLWDAAGTSVRWSSHVIHLSLQPVVSKYSQPVHCYMFHPMNELLLCVCRSANEQDVREHDDAAHTP